MVIEDYFLCYHHFLRLYRFEHEQLVINRKPINLVDTLPEFVSCCWLADCNLPSHIFHPIHHLTPEQFYLFCLFVCLLYYETLQRFPEQSYCLFIRFPNYCCLDIYNFSFCSSKITWKIIFRPNIVLSQHIHNYLFIYLEKWAKNATRPSNKSLIILFLRLLNYNRFFLHIGQPNEDFIYEMVGVISELKFPTTDSQT